MGAPGCFSHHAEADRGRAAADDGCGLCEMAGGIGTVVDGSGQAPWRRPTHDHELLKEERSAANRGYCLPSAGSRQACLSSPLCPSAESHPNGRVAPGNQSLALTSITDD